VTARNLFNNRTKRISYTTTHHVVN